MSASGRRQRGEHGAAALETALVLCFLVLPIVFATIGYGFMLSFRQTLSQSVAEGARAAAVAPAGTSLADRQAAATVAINSALAASGNSMKCGQNNITCTIQSLPSCGDGSSSSCIKVTVTYPYRSQPLVPNIPGLGIVMPSQLTYSATATVS